MRNLHELKSFHENALSEWNATALIMKEAMKGETDTRKTFVEVVVALSDMAGKDVTKRKNLIKAGYIVLHSMADGTWPKTPPPLPQESQKKPDRWKGVRRVVLTLFALILCAGSFAGGFALNMPLVVSHLPKLTKSTPEPSNTPEQAIEQYFEAVYRHDIPAIIAMYHPEVRQEVSDDVNKLDVVNDIYEYNKQAAKPVETHLDSVQEDRTAKAFMTFRLPNSGKQESGMILLRQFENAWYIMNVDF